MKTAPLVCAAALLTATSLLSGCGERQKTVAHLPASAAAPVVKEDADAEGQARAEAAGRAVVGKPAPPIRFTTIDGALVDLGKLSGRRPVYLKFWATWCAPCRAQMPAFKADFDKYGDRIQVVAVNAGFNDDLLSVRRYRQELALSMPIAIDDGRLAEAFHLRVTPQHVVIARDGTVLYVGHREDEALHRALEQAMATPEGEGFSAGAPSPSLPGAIAPSITGASRRFVLFLSPWCETYLAKSRPATGEACRAAREAASHRAGAEIAAVASGLWADDGAVRRFVADTHFPVPVRLDQDGAIFRRYGVTQVPTVIELGANDRVLARAQGPQAARLLAGADRPR